MNKLVMALFAFASIGYPFPAVAQSVAREQPRCKMAVVNFNLRNKSFSWQGEIVDSVEWVVALGNYLNSGLGSAGRFQMLDRAFDQEIDAELSRISAKNADPRDIIKLNGKLSTDYLLVGEVALDDVRAPRQDPLTWQLVVDPALFAEVNYRIIHAPTGEMVYSGNVRLDSSDFIANSVREFVSVTAESAARVITDAVMRDVAIEVVEIRPGRLVVGAGRAQLSRGEKFVVCANDGMAVAIAEIVDTEATQSYAYVLCGVASRVQPGARLRRIARPMAYDAADVETPVDDVPLSTVHELPGGGVVAPF